MIYLLIGFIVGLCLGGAFIGSIMAVRERGYNMGIDASNDCIKRYREVISKFYTPDGTPTTLNLERRKGKDEAPIDAPREKEETQE